jgi:hypothetical protein
MKEKDKILVATATVVEELMKDPDQLPPVNRQKAGDRRSPPTRVRLGD